jgi:peptidoglycan/LPS O-acetylase OafA/YrhL
MKQAVRERYEELAAFRGLGWIIIVIGHSYQTSAFIYEGHWVDDVFRNADIGLAIFFLLSGFFVYLPFAQAAVRGGDRPGIRDYLSRRFWRVMPLYLAVILIVWDLRYYGALDQWKDLVLHMTFTQVFSSKYIFWTDGPAWSLAIEVQFYLLIALIAPLMHKVSSRLPRPGSRVAFQSSVIAGLILISLAYKAVGYYVLDLPWEKNYAFYFSPLSRLDEYAMGMLLAVWWAWRGGRGKVSSGVATTLATASIGLIVGTAFLRMGSRDVELFWYAIASLGVIGLVVASAGATREWLGNRLLGSRPLMWAGAISYSVFLLDEPVIVELRKLHLLSFTDAAAWPLVTVAVLALSVAVATFAYHFIEQPGLKARKLLARVSPKHRRRTELVHPPIVPLGRPVAGLSSDGGPAALFVTVADEDRDRHPLLTGVPDQATVKRWRTALARLGVETVSVSGHQAVALTKLLGLGLLRRPDGRQIAAPATVLVDASGRVASVLDPRDRGHLADVVGETTRVRGRDLDRDLLAA